MKRSFAMLPAALAALCLAASSVVSANHDTENKVLPTLWIIGDSTVKNGTAGLQGWGDPIADFFDKTKIQVSNLALGGRSSRTFLTEGRWDAVSTKLKSGDFVLIQFGHNDGGSPTSSYRASLKGVGDNTESVTNSQNGKQEIIHSYGWYLKQYIHDAKALHALPIVLSPIPRDIFGSDGKVARNIADYGGWSAQVAKSEDIPFIDLNALIAAKYDAMGADKVKAQYFPGDHTHTNPAGALLNAQSVVEDIRSLTRVALRDDLLPAQPAKL